jgi:hypothetical protein
MIVDVSSTYFEGKCCPLGQLGHSRDEKKGRYCQELWIGGAWLGGFLPIFLVFTAFDLNTINERNTSTHQG